MTDYKTPELIDEQRGAAEKRRAFARSPLRQIAARMRQAVRDYLEARAKGLEREHAVKHLEAELREVMPLTKYPPAVVCETCEDSGWEPQECEGDEGTHGPICGRRFMHGGHTFVRPCYCDKGEAIRRQTAPKPTEDMAVEAAAKASRRRVNNWARAGR